MFFSSDFKPIIQALGKSRYGFDHKSNQTQRIREYPANRYICKNYSMDTEKTEAFYKKLKKQLLETSTWPSDYLYKFIVPTDDDRIKQIQDVFDGTGAVIESRQSKKGKYTSISVTVNLENPDEVIEKYKVVGQVEGVISL